MSVTRWRLLTLVLVVVASVLSACAARPDAASAGARRGGAGAPCGTVAPAAVHYRHVVWILLENEGSSVMGSSSAPYLNSLAHACGLATNAHAAGHPSLPNYLALTSGSTQGVTDDGEPSEHPLAGESLFGQLRGNWRALEESMPSDCDRVTADSYAARHNPPLYYTALAPVCRRNDVPLSTPLQLSAAFTFITPNICDDMHSCPIATGDAWLRRMVPAILASSEYRAHSLVLFITFDENDHDATNQVPIVVVAPSVRKGARVGQPFSDYSLLRTTEQLLGLGYLGAARSASSMVQAFRL